ncbi:DUF6415 family natural product biosynthesis protein [Streptomyces sp. CG4]|uniref:DUF6415 family natural product biosynthesis protein n=1 Tax=Streptomyces sp. CG4 TaxID=408783 RepID=UPI0034E21162
MTALGTPAAPLRVDAARIRRTYEAVLLSPRLPAGEEARAHLAGLLRGHMRLTLPGAEARLTDLPVGFDWETVEHVVDKARKVLERPVLGASSAEDVYDLATMSRALLTLRQFPSKRAITDPCPVAGYATEPRPLGRPSTSVRRRLTEEGSLNVSGRVARSGRPRRRREADLGCHQARPRVPCIPGREPGALRGLAVLHRVPGR